MPLFYYIIFILYYITFPILRSANKTHFHFKHARGLHSSKSNLRGEAEHTVPEAPSQAHGAGDILPGPGIARARESLGGAKREGGSVPINLPEPAQALTLLTADIWRKKITLQVPPREQQMVKRQNVKLRARGQAGQKAKSIIFQHQGRNGDPTAAHKLESDTCRNSLKTDRKSLHSGSSSLSQGGKNRFSMSILNNNDSLFGSLT